MIDGLLGRGERGAEGDRREIARRPPVVVQRVRAEVVEARLRVAVVALGDADRQEVARPRRRCAAAPLGREPVDDPVRDAGRAAVREVVALELDDALEVVERGQPLHGERRLDGVLVLLRVAVVRRVPHLGELRPDDVGAQVPVAARQRHFGLHVAVVEILDVALAVARVVVGDRRVERQVRQLVERHPQCRVQVEPVQALVDLAWSPSVSMRAIETYSPLKL